MIRTGILEAERLFSGKCLEMAAGCLVLYRSPERGSPGVLGKNVTFFETQSISNYKHNDGSQFANKFVFPFSISFTGHVFCLSSQ